MKLISYNIQNYERDWPARLPKITDLINKSGADIVALNEVRGRFDFCPNQAEQLAAALGGYWHVAVSQAMFYTPPDFNDTPPDWEGLAILSRQPYPMLQTGSLALTQAAGDNNRRIVQFASFRVRLDKPLYVFNYHATLNDGPDFDTNLKEVLAYTAAYDGYRLLVGDLNQPHQGNLCDATKPCVPPKLQPLEQAGWTDLWMQYWNQPNHSQVGYTWQLVGNQAPPSKRLDYQWVSGAALLKSFRSIDVFASTPVDGLYLSDHIGLISEFAV